MQFVCPSTELPRAIIAYNDCLLTGRAFLHSILFFLRPGRPDWLPSIANKQSAKSAMFFSSCDKH